jgi:hypothetical protein
MKVDGKREDRAFYSWMATPGHFDGGIRKVMCVGNGPGDDAEYACINDHGNAWITQADKTSTYLQAAWSKEKSAPPPAARERHPVTDLIGGLIVGGITLALDRQPHRFARHVAEKPWFNRR